MKIMVFRPLILAVGEEEEKTETRGPTRAVLAYEIAVISLISGCKSHSQWRIQDLQEGGVPKSMRMRIM